VSVAISPSENAVVFEVPSVMSWTPYAFAVAKTPVLSGWSDGGSLHVAVVVPRLAK